MTVLETPIARREKASPPERSVRKRRVTGVARVAAALVCGVSLTTAAVRRRRPTRGASVAWRRGCESQATPTPTSTPSVWMAPIRGG
jgi:hypothetical protein